MWDLKNNDTNELIYKAETDLENELMVTGVERWCKGLVGVCGIKLHTVIFKMDNQQTPTV